MDTPSGRSHQGSRSGLGRRSASQGALPQTGRTRQHASYGAWFQAQQTDDRSAEVIRLAKPTSYWPYGKDVTTLAGTGNARDVYKILGTARPDSGEAATMRGALSRSGLHRRPWCPPTCCATQALQQPCSDPLRCLAVPSRTGLCGLRVACTDRRCRLG
uniref:Uncharacterized protein n=1 Tax=Alexandrium monilatum TaxID=311494 RepID=A0A7S4QTZ7_9DINO